MEAISLTCSHSVWITRVAFFGSTFVAMTVTINPQAPGLISTLVISYLFQFLSNRLDQIFLSGNETFKLKFTIDSDGRKGPRTKFLEHGDSLSIPQTPLMVIDSISDLFWEVGYC